MRILHLIVAAALWVAAAAAPADAASDTRKPTLYDRVTWKNAVTMPVIQE